MGAMTIAGLARAGGVGVETIRYYQRRGLLALPGGERGGRRYAAADVARLRFIRAAQSAGFKLAEIADLLALDSTADRAQARGLARTRIAALDAEIAALQNARDALQRLATECGAGTSGPCPILTAFERPPAAA